MTRQVVTLPQAASAPLSMVGGKARALGELVRAGFPVPQGAVVAPEIDLTDLDQVDEVRELGVGPFAVRSSGENEDAADSSLAGRYTTVLGVEGRSIAQAVAEVRESGKRIDGRAIPVVIQKMIDPQCAGVAFTADPVSGNRSTTVITATAGLADRLVSGEIPGDEWRVEGGRPRAVHRTEGVLTRRLMKRVVSVSEEIEEFFGAPQDIEWAWDGSNLWIVQARPITGLPAEVSWDPPAPGVYNRSLRFGEWISEPITPLFDTWLLPRMERRLHDYLFEQVGQVAPEPLHVTVNGWYYYSLNWLPLPGVAFTRNLINIAKRLRVDWRKAAPMFPQTVRFAYQEYEDDWRDNVLPEYQRLTAKAEEQVEELSTGGLVEMVDRLATAAGRYFAAIATVAGSAYKFESQLAQFWNKHLKSEVGVSHMVVLRGFDLPPVTYLTPRLETLDWSVPPVAPGRRPENASALEAARVDAVQKAERVIAGSNRKLKKFRRLLSEAQHTVPVREELLSQLSLPWPTMRRGLERLGETLSESGAIDSPDDIYYLTRPEVDALTDEPVNMSDEIAERREQRQRASRLNAPLWVGDVPRLAKFMFSYSDKVMGADHADDAIVHGVPASPGRATGRVRVIRDSSQFDDFLDGEILVAPLTAPAWTDLFTHAAAVVTDVGSALAHASIIAREYGIPAVVGCGDATSRLRDGQMVEVEGSTGNVRLIDSNSSEVAPERSFSRTP
jgi:phosphohistidine swiveling domain-containing protein